MKPQSQSGSKLKYRIVSISSEDDGYPASELYQLSPQAKVPSISIITLGMVIGQILRVPSRTHHRVSKPDPDQLDLVLESPEQDFAKDRYLRATVDLHGPQPQRLKIQKTWISFSGQQREKQLPSP